MSGTSLQRILVAGHAGYIGAVMMPRLREEGFSVTDLDTCYFEGCDLDEVPCRIPDLRTDVRDVRAPDLAGFDAIIHLGGLSNDPLGDLQPTLTDEINHASSVRLARAAKIAGVRRFLYASSCSVYGASGDAPLTEEAALTAYAKAKVRTEQGLAQLADADFSSVFLHNSTAYGISPHLRVDVVLNNQDTPNYRVNFEKIGRRLPELRVRSEARTGVRELRENFARLGLKAKDFQSRRYSRFGHLKYLWKLSGWKRPCVGPTVTTSPHRANKGLV
jgi:nucleoside-diphosphate-sugar epimerase